MPNVKGYIRKSSTERKSEESDAMRTHRAECGICRKADDVEWEDTEYDGNERVE